jgi:hypothetical protein
MRKSFLVFIFIISFINHAQIRTTNDTLSVKKVNEIGFDLTQNAFMNWNAGGNNAVSGILKILFVRNYAKNNWQWSNELIMRYGLNKQEEREWRKTEDVFNLTSTFGYKQHHTDNWLYSAKFNLRTQFADGFNYPNNENPISRLFAPAYWFLGVGSEYNNRDKQLNFYLSPLTQKTTFIFDNELSNRGAFGVKPGEKIRNEIGIFVSNVWKKEIYTNVVFENRLTLFTDYFNNFGNVDFDWLVNFDLIVNKYIRANIQCNLVYDDDIKTTDVIDGQKVTSGPRVQLKQLLGVGMVYNF